MATSARSQRPRPRRLPSVSICGGAVRSGISRRVREGLLRRCERGISGGQVCSRWHSPQVGYGGHWDGRLLVSATEKCIEMLLVHSPGVLVGVCGRAVKSAELHLLGINVQDTSSCSRIGDRSARRCVREAGAVPVGSPRPHVQAIVAGSATMG